MNRLLFADDSFIFTQSSLQECQNVKTLLKLYEKSLGEAINYEKSCVSFIGNLTEFDGQLIANCLGVSRVPYHDRYLGLSVFVGKAKKATFAYKLNGWHGNLLSNARKELLIKTVAQAIPLYTMQTFILPKTLCNELNQMVDQFWWERNQG